MEPFGVMLAVGIWLGVFKVAKDEFGPYYCQTCGYKVTGGKRHQDCPRCHWNRYDKKPPNITTYHFTKRR